MDGLQSINRFQRVLLIQNPTLTLPLVWRWTIEVHDASHPRSFAICSLST